MPDTIFGEKLATNLNFKEFSILAPSSPSFISTNGSSNIDFVITSNNLENLFSDVVTDADVELYSGAPNRGHIPILTTAKIMPKNSTVPPKIKPDLKSIDWNNWTDTLEAKLSQVHSTMQFRTAVECWTDIKTAIEDTTLEQCKVKVSSIHSKPFWTPQLTVAADKLRDAKKEFMKRNTLSTKEMYEAAKESFDTMRKTECERFILSKTQRLNSVQCQKFWKEFKRMFGPKTVNNIKPLKTTTDNLTSDVNEMENILFKSFFGGQHLTEKGRL